MNKKPELLTELLLHRWRDLFIWDVVKTCCGDLRGEPVGFGKADCEGDEVFFDLLWGKLFADFVERFYGLSNISLHIR